MGNNSRNIAGTDMQTERSMRRLLLSALSLMIIGLLFLCSPVHAINTKTIPLRSGAESDRFNAMQVYYFCTKRELVSEVYRRPFALMLARSMHLEHADMRGTPENVGTSLCLIELQKLPMRSSSEEIASAVSKKELVSAETDAVAFDAKQNPGRRYLAPFARDYFEGLARDFGSLFPGRKYKVTSLLRTTSEQAALAHKKVSPLNCDPSWFCSAHTTGTAFDISLKDLAPNEVEFLQLRLRVDILRLRVVAIKEEKSGCFHVQVIDPEFVKDTIKQLDEAPIDNGEETKPIPIKQIPKIGT